MEVKYNKIIRFSIPEGIIFNKPSLKTPEARGPFTSQRSYKIPPLSTIIGTLLTILYNKDKQLMEKIKEISWDNFEKINDIFKEINLDIYGPLLTDEKCIYFNYLDNIVLFDKISIEKLKETDIILEIKNRITRKDKKVFSSNEKIAYKINKIGIALENDEKIVKEGYLYSQEILMYKKDPNSRLYIDILVNGDNNNLDIINDEIVRFGAKGRISKVNIIDKNDLYNIIFSINDYNYGILISDAILNIKLDKIDIDNKDYYDIIKELNKNIMENYKFSIVHGILEYSSLGWDINKDKPKPYVLKVKAGSIIEIHDKSSFKVGELKNLGFGSFIPF